ncbi:MAG: YifB family Mg chelatase-like AAA ATPase [Lachnospiraceae bacterium]|nr:YifB family Mg chelatase-like AAA ATPase [Lachnospiraceae bacterium]
MYNKVQSAVLHGMEVHLVEVQADISEGLPVFDMVGLPGSEVKESRERVRTALRNSGFRIPPKRITVNLSPADLKKEGTAFDLPIAAAILRGITNIPDAFENGIIIGEVGLDGSVIPVRGAISIAKHAQALGYCRILCAKENAEECRNTAKLSCIGVSSLKEMAAYLQEGTLPPQESCITEETMPSLPDFSDLAGLEVAKRAAEIAVAGRHHFLMVGPPGAGKTMIAKRMMSIFPALNDEERNLQAELLSIMGLPALSPDRPFRSPDASVTAAAFLGGGQKMLPGEMVLANDGILFLDELPSYPSRILDLLRIPMEEGKVILTRKNGAYEFPADFMFVGAMNPCPCGFYPDMQRCKCTPDQRIRYRRRVDGPLLDRIDLYLSLQPMDYEGISGGRGCGENSETIRGRVTQAWERQQNRYEKEKFHFNARMPAEKIPVYCALGRTEQSLMERYYKRYRLSARAYHKVLKVARTIADLDGSDQIRSAHLTEAIHLRCDDPEAEGRLKR